MECVANFEITTECSIVSDDLVLRVKHPNGRYRLRIQNITRTTFTTPFLLSFHLYFDAPSLDDASEIGEELLADCLNMLAFTTGSRFKRHRIRQTTTATSSVKSGVRLVKMWADTIEYEDPQPFLSAEIAQAIERLLQFDVPPAIRRAMRWYRLGINETNPDDQFVYFWFALELIAEFQKSIEKVHDKCPQCQSPLYCESCETHPLHKPYAKQAIRALLKAADKDCDDVTIERLDKTRNDLMHGATLREIEARLPQPHEQIVDVLGQLLWRALVLQFPHEMFDGSLEMGFPSAFVHRQMQTVANIEMAVPLGSDGDLDLTFAGFKAEMKPFGPPQSALPKVIRMSSEQYEHLGRLKYSKGDQQELCQRVHDNILPARANVKLVEGEVFAVVLATDVRIIKDALKRGETGAWQDLFREIVGEATSVDE